eukprot:CAMPEP_0185384494 /NCGR_PEP_ID=MMETSP1364-20130426/60002_1 /TAXON_ID=38817 /ORGANISM="Gephyrocapsa oceanica, Strain RCC1303" /LENGTH=222 /DNA_ID=CAMNT_0027986265 /DNA_START=125 /DNA_END=794 /DNA_ORIENTATION=+
MSALGKLVDQLRSQNYVAHDAEAPRTFDGVPPSPSLWDRARQAAGVGPPTAREELVDQVCPSMTFQQRLYAFAICFCISVAISITSVFSVAQLIGGRPGPFAVKCACGVWAQPGAGDRPRALLVRYTLGNVLSLLSTGFILGPKRQIKNMSHPTRAASALVYIGAMVATLVSAVGLQNALLVLVSVIVQFAAMAWYVLSYIPYGQRIASSFAARLLGSSDEG